MQASNVSACKPFFEDGGEPSNSQSVAIALLTKSDLTTLEAAVPVNNPSMVVVSKNIVSDRARYLSESYQ